MLHEIQKVSIAADMVAGLRLVANEIEQGVHPGARFVVTVIMNDEGELSLWSHGSSSTLEVIGVLTKASNLNLGTRR